MMHRRMIGFIFSLVFIQSHASTGGVPVDAEKFAYPVWLQPNNSYVPPSSAFCMGAQIDPHKMVTAAHCLEDLPVTKKMIHVFRKMADGVFRSLFVTAFSIHPDYGKKPATYSIDPHDVGIVETRTSFPAGNLEYKVGFDPYAYLEQQPRKEILVDDFGFNREARQVYTGKAIVMNDDGCIRQIDDLLQHEGTHLSQDEMTKLLGIVLQFETNPQSLFCSFIKKTDDFQHEKGDSGAPLVFKINEKATLAGLLTAIVPIPSSQRYSMITLYSNVASSKNFFEQCVAPKVAGGSSFVIERTPRSASDSCVYQRIGVENMVWLQLLFE